MYDNQMAMALEWLNDAVSIAQRPADEQPPLWQAWEAEIERGRGSLAFEPHRDDSPS